MVNRAIENSQVRVEGYHFDIRKHLVEYDDVINTQRELIYSERRKILSGADLKENILSMVSQEISEMVAAHISDDLGINRDIPGLIGAVAAIMTLPADITAESLEPLSGSEIETRLIETAGAIYEQKEQDLGADDLRLLERVLMLRVMDNLWIDHLTAMEHMRQGIGLQAVAQRDPLVAYKREGHSMFQDLLENVRHDLVRSIFRAGIVRREAVKPVAQARPTVASGGTAGGGSTRPQPKTPVHKVGRNDPCPCGSGKKYKKCCGRNAG
jgi:preprotein translocase subunit SecA